MLYMSGRELSHRECGPAARSASPQRAVAWPPGSSTSYTRPALRPDKGYGNDSRQNGPLSSRILHINLAGQFAFYVETRPQRLTQRRATNPLTSLTRPVFQPFLRLSSLVAWPRRRRNEVGFAARLRTLLSSSAEWVRWVSAPLGPSPRAGSVPRKAMWSQMLGSEWPILSRIVAIPHLLAGQGDLAGCALVPAGGGEDRRHPAGACQPDRVGQCDPVRAVRIGPRPGPLTGILRAYFSWRSPVGARQEEKYAR